jgi:hypothetical protein
MPTTKRMQESTEGFANIDRDAGVIRGVKVLGLKSRNRQGKREYLREAASKAVSLYEGRKIYIDHVKLEESAKSRSTRQTGERWGKLLNVAPDDAGELRGDLHYIKTHPMTEQILEAAERFNDFGLSHDASGKVQEENGKEVVYELTEVHSVDIVQDPATNKNLFESVQTMKKNLRAVLRENIKQSQAPFLLARLTEMADIYDDAMEMEVEPETSPEDQVKEAFKTAIMAILDGDYSTEEQIAKIKMLLDVQTELAGGEGAAKKSTPPTDGESPMTEAEVKSSCKTELTQLQRRKAAQRSQRRLHSSARRSGPRGHGRSRTSHGRTCRRSRSQAARRVVSCQGRKPTNSLTIQGSARAEQRSNSTNARRFQEAARRLSQQRPANCSIPAQL